MVRDSIQLNIDRPTSLQNFRTRMRGAPVHILRGPYVGKHGTVIKASFDATIQNTVYTILIGEGEDEIQITVPAADCAIYYPVDYRVRVISGTYTGKRGHVTACNYNAAERFYEIRICLPADQFEASAFDYLPYDIHITLPATMLAPAV